MAKYPNISEIGAYTKQINVSWPKSTMFSSLLKVRSQHGQDNIKMLCLEKKKHLTSIFLYSAANKGQSMVNYCQSLAFDCPYLSCNDHCDQWLFQGLLLLLLSFLFHRNSFERSWTCFLGIVKHSKQLSILCLRVDL